MKCGNCGIELLGSMKKCPKCGYNVETGKIDREYLAALDESRQKSGSAAVSERMCGCDGMYLSNGRLINKAQIVILKDHTLSVTFEKPGDRSGRAVARVVGGLAGVALYNELYRETVVVRSVRMDDIDSVVLAEPTVMVGGWTVRLRDGDEFTVTMDEPVKETLRSLLGLRWRLYEPPETKKYRCGTCGEAFSCVLNICPKCGATGGIGLAKYLNSNYPVQGNDDSRREQRPESQPEEKTFCIRWIRGPLAGKRMPVRGQMSIGRAAGCSIQLPADTQKVDELHCALAAIQGKFYVQDLGSAYGTTGNAIYRLPPHQAVILSPGDMIAVGSDVVAFVVE